MMIETVREDGNMKKLAIVIMLLVFLVSASCAEVDITSMSAEELAALRQQIDEIIGYPIQGDFVVGVDIKEGYYSLTCISNEDGSLPWMVLYEDEARKKKKGPSGELNPEQSFIIHLSEHNVLRINNTPALISPVEAPSWKP